MPPDHQKLETLMSRPVVLITGASRGIGAATAVFFAIKGWRVAITARTLTEGAQMENQLRCPGGQLLSGSLESTAKAIEAAGGECFRMSWT
jgi:NAD(P)-dependent dehydrogenase (short-subunit alcohol dehydrogenase family)